MNILLADDHALVRAGTRILIDQIDDFRVVGEAEGTERGLALLRERAPDLVVTDLHMPNMGGIEFIGRARHAGFPLHADPGAHREPAGAPRRSEKARRDRLDGQAGQRRRPHQDRQASAARSLT
jgi:hypothetical protein